MRVDDPPTGSFPQASAARPAVNALASPVATGAKAPAPSSRPAPAGKAGADRPLAAAKTAAAGKSTDIPPQQVYRPSGRPPSAPAATGQPSAMAEQARHREERARQSSGHNPKPTKAWAERPPAQLSSAPPRSPAAGGSGMERAMGALADKLHAPRRR